MTTESPDTSNQGTLEQLMLQEAIKEVALRYGKNKHTPEFLTEIWKDIWNIWAARAQITDDLDPPLLHFPQEKLDHLEKYKRMVLFIPPAFAKIESIPQFEKLFPDISLTQHIKDIKLVPFTHSFRDQQSGWLDIDIPQEPPYIGNNEDDVTNILTELKLVRPTLNTYVIANQAVRLLLGSHNLDQQSSWTQLETGEFSNTTASRPLRARFDKTDKLHIERLPISMHPEDTPIYLRTVRMLQAA